jgi:hypothetical protein
MLDTINSGPRPMKWRPHAAVAIALAAICGTAVSASEIWQIGAGQPAADEEPERGGESANQAVVQQIRSLIAGLDAPSFAARKQANRELLSRGKVVIPYLVQALGEKSSEVRLRAHLLLTDHYDFEDIAPHLINAAGTHYGSRARSILRQRAVQHIDAACQSGRTDKLFKFWGTTAELYRADVAERLDEAETRDQTARAVEPLFDFCEKAARFGTAAERLESLSLPHEHRHSPGFFIAETFARGLSENHPGLVAFAERYIDALEKLVFQIRLRTDSTYTIRKEVSDRATMSTSAVEYLVQILDESSPERTILCERIGIPPDWLQQEFCRGLALVDPVACHRQIGKVHIADMLTRVLTEWPDVPSGGIVEELVASTSKTAVSGDKPKALALLDALKACRDLPKHRLDLQSGLGKQLGERLAAAALDAPDSRAYHPARSVHDKLLKIVDLGISPEHSAFPRRLLEDHLRAADRVATDEQRLAFERYLRILERLDAAGMNLDHPQMERFVLAMRDCLTAEHDLLAVGANRLDSVLGSQRRNVAKPDADTVRRALANWMDAGMPR